MTESLNPFEGIENKTRRVTAPGIDSLIGKKFPVLSDGFISVVGYMGDESSIVQAARVSYGAGTKKVSEDRGLIRYLLRHNHGTPIEMCQIKLHIRIPMDAWRQWVRHRSFSINEYSTRYSEAIDSQDTTKPDEWRKQGKGNKQGSFGTVEEWPDVWSVPEYFEAGLKAELGGGTPGEYLTHREKTLHVFAKEIYQERITFGVAREVARKDLPLSTYTEAYWCGNLRNLLHFLGLRMDSHAQKEIRDYADIIGKEIVAKWVPNVWEAFNDYHPLRDAISFTAPEVAALKLSNESANEGVVFESFPVHFLPDEWRKAKKKGAGLTRNRERDEFAEKLRSIGIKPGW